MTVGCARSRTGRRAALVGGVLAMILLAGLVGARGASATIVWSKGGDIWAMNDDGSGQRMLVSKAAVGMDTLRSPGVSPSGSSVFFTGETSRNKVTRTGLCGTFPYSPCITTHFGFYFTGTYRWSAGSAQRLSPEPSYCFNCSDGTEEPEPRADGSYVAAFTHCQGFFDDGSYECLGSIVDSGGRSYPAACNGESLTGELPSGPSPDPADPSRIVYAGCGAGGQPSALIVTGPDHGGERIVACDDSTQTDPSWSPSGGEIVAAEGGTEAGIWVYGAGNDGCFSGQLREAVSAPSGVAFSSPTFVGSDRIAFAAQGEIWTVPASCNACSFPGSATKLTSGGDNADPAWTSDALAVPTPPSPTPTPGDTTAPRLTFKLAKRQRVLGQGGKVLLKLRASEACRVTIRTKIVLPGKDLSLKKTSRSLATGKLTTIRLKLSAKALKAVRRAWRKHRTPKAKLSIAAVDASGNATNRSQQIALIR